MIEVPKEKKVDIATFYLIREVDLVGYDEKQVWRA